MQDRLSWTAAACERLLRPLVRLALGHGLKYTDLEESLRSLLLDEAARLWRDKGTPEPNVSQLAVTTGLNRKDITARIRRPENFLPRTEVSAAAKTFTLWQQLAEVDPTLQRLPIASDAADLSFETMARQATRGDVHHKTVLDELSRLGMVRKSEGFVELTTDAFVPANDLENTLAFLADNGRDHLAAAVRNTLGGQPPLLERSVFADGITQADCDVIHKLVRQRWGSLHRELVTDLTDAVDRVDGQGENRIRIGIYVFHETSGTP